MPKWTSCCRGRDNCPQIAIDDRIHIRDDHGGQIKLTPKEFIDVSRQIRESLTELVEAEGTPDQEKLEQLFRGCESSEEGSTPE